MSISIKNGQLQSKGNGRTEREGEDIVLKNGKLDEKCDYTNMICTNHPRSEGTLLEPTLELIEKVEFILLLCG